MSRPYMEKINNFKPHIGVPGISRAATFTSPSLAKRVVGSKVDMECMSIGLGTLFALLVFGFLGISVILLLTNFIDPIFNGDNEKEQKELQYKIFQKLNAPNLEYKLKQTQQKLEEQKQKLTEEIFQKLGGILNNCNDIRRLILKTDISEKCAQTKLAIEQSKLKLVLEKIKKEKEELYKKLQSVAEQINRFHRTEITYSAEVSTNIGIEYHSKDGNDENNKNLTAAKEALTNLNNGNFVVNFGEIYNQFPDLLFYFETTQHTEFKKINDSLIRAGYTWVVDSKREKSDEGKAVACLVYLNDMWQVKLDALMFSLNPEQ